MCYSYTAVFSEKTAQTYNVPKKEFDALVNDHAFNLGTPHPFFAKSTVPIIVAKGEKNHLMTMHWDLIPRWFHAGEPLSAEEVFKLKNSKKNGFTSYNARTEDLLKKPSFHKPWLEGQRCLFPGVMSFQERPNRKDMPTSFPKHAYTVAVKQETCFAGMYDVWKGKDGTTIYSATVLTLNGMNHPVMQSIWHGRQPAMMTIEDGLQYLSDETAPTTALTMLRSFPPTFLKVLPSNHSQ